jgi:putative PIN family toxin of toxin-antitoxin system
MKVVLDTNILVSGTFWTGDSYKILKKIDEKELELFISKEISEEYYETLNSDYITDKTIRKNLSVNEIVVKIINNAIFIVPSQKFNEIKDDPDDNIILECAIEGNVDYIVSQDKHLLKLKEFKDIKIITPEEFLKILKNILRSNKVY